LKYMHAERGLRAAQAKLGEEGGVETHDGPLFFETVSETRGRKLVMKYKHAVRGTEFIETGKIQRLEEMREEEETEDTELNALIEVYAKQDEIKAKVKWDAFVEAHRPLRFDFLQKPFTLFFATEHCLPHRTKPQGCVVRINAGYYQREVKHELEKIIHTPEESNYDVDTLKAKVREYKWTFSGQHAMGSCDDTEAWPYEHNDKIVQTDLERYEGTVDDTHHFVFRVHRDCEPLNAGEWGLKSSGWTPPGLGDYLAETLGKKCHYWLLEAK
jgi:hypothetical protein